MTADERAAHDTLVRAVARMRWHVAVTLAAGEDWKAMRLAEVELALALRAGVEVRG